MPERKRYLITHTVKNGPVTFDTDSPEEAKVVFGHALEMDAAPCSVTDRELNMVVLESAMPPKQLVAMLEERIRIRSERFR